MKLNKNVWSTVSSVFLGESLFSVAPPSFSLTELVYTHRPLHLYSRITVEPPNKGRFGANIFVPIGRLSLSRR